jgi:ElaB/YqjD/DUF883 family membrane-anchored ribosome-binding protein
MTSKTETDVAPEGPTSTEELRQQAKAVKEDLRGLGHAAKVVAQEKLGGAKQKAAEYLDEGKHKTAEYLEQGKQKASEFEDQIENYIRQKPLKSVLIAAGAGALLGFLISRR